MLRPITCPIEPNPCTKPSAPPIWPESAACEDAADKVGLVSAKPTQTKLVETSIAKNKELPKRAGPASNYCGYKLTGRQHSNAGNYHTHLAKSVRQFTD